VTGSGLRARRLRLVQVGLACLVVLVIGTASHAADPLPPELTQPVNDFAHVIDPQSAASLEQQIRTLQAATGDVIVVATIDTFSPYADIRDYAVKMFENHGRGIGDKAKDNGVLVLVAVKDRKVWVEVGYALEQFITDGYAGEVSRTAMAPAFARGDYGGGVFAGVSQFAARIAQGRGVTLTATAPPAAATRRRTAPGSSAGLIGMLILFLLRPPVFIVLIALFTFFSRMRRQSRGMAVRRRWGAGPWSGWNSGVGPFRGGGGGFGGGGFGGGFGGFGGGGSGGGGGGASW
jgi:uncharacterized protein